MAKEVVKVSPETREAYEAPKCEVMELQMEGVLCQMEGVLCKSGDRPLPPDFEGDGGYHEEDGNQSRRR